MLEPIPRPLALIVLAACGGESDPAAAKNPPAAADLPAEERVVSFPAERITLEGTLLLPARSQGERVPGVVLVHGSGPNDRDEPNGGQLGMTFGFEIPVLRELAVALQRDGFAVLRYDKRTCGTFNGCAENGYPSPDPDLLEDVFVHDAEAALDHLASLPEVDPGSLHYLGHSEGAQFAPRVLTDRPAVRTGVMLAGPHGNIAELIAYQARKLEELLRLSGASDAVIEAQVGPLRRVGEQLLELAAGTFVGDSIDGISSDYWESWIAIGEAAPGLARALDRPLLALSGDYDWNVPPQETEAWRATFAGTPHEAVVLPCVTHALNCITEPDPFRIGPEDLGRHVHESVLGAVIEFLDAKR